MTKTELLAAIANADDNAEITVYLDDKEGDGFQYGFAIREIHIAWSTEAHDANAPQGDCIGITLEGAING